MCSPCELPVFNNMTTQFTPEDITVVCHVRPSLVLEPVDAKIETLRTCESQGTIDALLLRSWPAEVSLGDGGPHNEVVERFERFQQWASRHDVDVTPPFRVRTATSIASDEETETLLTPGICLALYHEERLRCVVPHTDGETTYTVSETIAALRTGELPAPLASVASTEPAQDPIVRTAPAASRGQRSSVDARSDQGARSDQRPAPTCPDCDEPLANVQGMLTCIACEWVDVRPRSPIASR